MGEKARDKMSGSEKAHKFLSGKNIGFTFTASELRGQVMANYSEVTEGMVSGFITRAMKKGMIKVNTPATATYPTIYEVASRVVWDFKAAGVGSVPGRKIAATPRPVLKAPVSEQLLELAAQVSQMEVRKEKRLSDYTTDELLSEIKSRTEGTR